MSSFFRDLVAAVRLADVVDVLLLSLVLYVGIGLVRRSRSGSAARRVVALGFVFAFVYAVADVFQLYLMERLLGVLLIGILVAVVVVFQADVRRLLDRIGAWSLSGRRSSITPASPVDILTEASARLADRKIGALIAIRGSEPWDSHLQGGIELGGRVSRPLLYSIFQPESPGHDGAVLLEGDRVARFAAHLPLATQLPPASRFGGTRHAAALGLAEECDALVIVVSEERGTISVAHEGTLEEMGSAAELGQRLESFWRRHYSEEETPGGAGWWSRRSVETAAMSVALAASAWLLFSYSGDTIYRSYEIPVEFRNLPPGWTLQRDTALTALVTLAGSDQAFRRLDPGALAVSFDLEEPEAGPNELDITAEQLRLPSGVRLYDVNPRELTVGIERQVQVELPVRVRTVGELPDSLVLTTTPERITVLAGDTADLPDHLETQPVDPAQIPRFGTTRVRLVLPPGIRLEGEQQPEVAVRLRRSAPAP